MHVKRCAVLRRSFLVALLLGAGCELHTGSSPRPGLLDALPVPDAEDLPEPPCDCNPFYGQSCCDDGDKCAPMHQATLDPRTSCVHDGVVPQGGVCTITPEIANTAHDDCAAGNVCVDEVCREICTTASWGGCDDDFTCTRVSNLFGEFERIGACVPSCDVVAQDCEQNPDHAFGTGCFLNLFDSTTICAPALPEETNGAPGVQGDACMYLNTCSVGYGCTVLNDPVNPTGTVCAFFCDADAGGGPTCGDGPGDQLTCVAIAGQVPNLPANVGVCVDCAVWTEVPECL